MDSMRNLVIAVDHIFVYPVEWFHVVRDLLDASNVRTGSLSEHSWCYKSHTLREHSVVMTRWGWSHAIPCHLDLELMVIGFAMRLRVSSLCLRTSSSKCLFSQIMPRMTQVLVRAWVLMMTLSQHCLAFTCRFLQAPIHFKVSILTM